MDADTVERNAIWAYPWDLAEREAAARFSEIRAAGLDAISIATIYHPVQALLPANPRRTWFTAARSAAYYQPDTSRYRALSPAAAGVPPDLLAGLFAAARKANLEPVAWIVLLHSTLAADHPECAVRTLDGTLHAEGLCPAHPAVREYALEVAEEVAERFNPAALDLEAVGWLGLPHHSHPKIGIPLDAATRYLVSLCVCEACLSLAPRGVERLLKEQLAIRISNPGGGLTVAELLDAQPDIYAFQAARERAITELVAAMRSVASARVRVIHWGDPFVAGIAYEGLGKVADGVVALTYTRDTVEFTRALDAVVASVPRQRVTAGISVLDSDAPSEVVIASHVAAARRLGLAGVSFTNYSLVNALRLDWIARALAVNDPNGRAGIALGSSRSNV